LRAFRKDHFARLRCKTSLNSRRFLRPAGSFAEEFRGTSRNGRKDRKEMAVREI
jgi:hypothetical protein